MNLVSAMIETHAVNFSFACFLVPALLIAAVILIARAARHHGLGRALLIAFGALATAVMALFWFRPSATREWSHTENMAWHESAGEVVQGEPRFDADSPNPGTATIATDQTPPVAEAAPGDKITSPAFSGELYADNYPSERAAAAALTRRILLSLDKVIPDGAKLGLLVIEKGSPSIAETVEKTARDVLPDVNVTHIHASDPPASLPAPGEDEARATLKLDTPTLTTGQTHIAMTLAGPTGRPIVQRVDAFDKPWVDGADLTPADPAVLRFPAQSDTFSDPAAARQQALDRAAARLQSVLELRLARFSAAPLNASDKRWLADTIREDLANSRWVADRFEQTIARPYSRMWRHALLISIPESDLSHAARQYRSDLDHRHSGVRSTFLAALGLALGIVVLYLFLNAATKGYYMWPLRLLGIVAVVAGVVLVLTLA